MKSLLVIFFALVACGCTTLKPVEMSPEELQQKIAAGEIIKVGDRVKVVTSDGVVHKFGVTEISTDRVSGKDVDLPIADIIAVETREFSGGKTTALVAGGTLIYVLLAAVAATATLGF
jgi:hypothetical protein